MRLDKYLKVSRLIKRRTVAKEVCDAGRVMLNGRPAKAGSDILPGDVLQISFGNKSLEAEVVAVAEAIKASEASTMYRIIKEVKMNPECEAK